MEYDVRHFKIMLQTLNELYIPVPATLEKGQSLKLPGKDTFCSYLGVSLYSKFRLS